SCVADRTWRTGIGIARADAADLARVGGHRRPNMDKAALLEKYDANHNGVLDPDEKAAMKKDWDAHRAARHAKLLEKYDTNHNGTIDPEERAAIKADHEARRAELVKKYATDGDGTLSPAD